MGDSELPDLILEGHSVHTVLVYILYVCMYVCMYVNVLNVFFLHVYVCTMHVACMCASSMISAYVCMYV